MHITYFLFEREVHKTAPTTGVAPSRWTSWAPHKDSPIRSWWFLSVQKGIFHLCKGGVSFFLSRTMSVLPKFSVKIKPAIRHLGSTRVIQEMPMLENQVEQENAKSNDCGFLKIKTASLGWAYTRQGQNLDGELIDEQQFKTWKVRSLQG